MAFDNDHTVFVKNLPLNVTKEEIRNSFKDCGKIEDVKINFYIGCCSAQVTFMNLDSARKAMRSTTKTHQRIIGGKVVEVNAIKIRAVRSYNDGHKESGRFSDDSNRYHVKDQSHDQTRKRSQDWGSEQKYQEERRRISPRQGGQSNEVTKGRSCNYSQKESGRFSSDHYRVKDQSHDQTRKRSQDWGSEQKYQEERRRIFPRQGGQSNEVTKGRSYNDSQKESGRFSSDHYRVKDQSHDPTSKQSQDWSSLQKDREERRRIFLFEGLVKDREERRRIFLSEGLVDSTGQSNEIIEGAEHLPGSSHGDHDQVSKQLDVSPQNMEDLQEEVDRREKLLSTLTEKSQKLKDELASVKQRTLNHKQSLVELHECFLNMMKQGEKLKSCEEELQSLAKSALEDPEMTINLTP